MKTWTSLLLSLLIATLPATASASYRIAYSADGNQHDPDDWHASVLALAMIDAAGQKHRLVHFDYNNHLGANDAKMARRHRKNVMGAVRRLGYPAGRFFDNQSNHRGAVRSIARAITRSTGGSRLYLICAGPMEVCYRGIKAARRDKHRFVTVVSHSWWNENHTHNAQLQRRWSDILRDFAVQGVQIADQNHTAFRSHPNAWNWLKQQRHGDWLHRAVARSAGAGDASDAGMAYHVLQGRTKASQRARMSEIRSMFAGAAAAGNAVGRSGIVPPGRAVALEARNSNKCAQVARWSRANGANLEQRSCNGHGNQHWRFEPVRDRAYVLRSRHSNRCVEVVGKSAGNGANAVQYRCHRATHQQFRLVPRGDGWFSLQAGHSGKCLTVASGSTRNGATLHQWSCHGGWNQQFRFRRGS